MAKNQAKFFCENCGEEVLQNARFCKKCGRFFSSVRCPACGKVGPSTAFKNGCPVCGYADKGKNKNTTKSSQDISTKTKFSFGNKRHFYITHPARKSKNESSSGSLPLWIYVFSLLLLVVVIVLVIRCS